jgi:catechol 2,3-dioxygenase-like lactoylglutathione lyase family enzyme
MTAPRPAQVTHVFAGLPTADFDAALSWYERFFGRAPDRFPHDREAVWQLADSGLVYLVADTRRAGSGLLALIVDDLDGWVAGVAARGIAVGEIETLARGMRKTVVTDPDGNAITLGQPMSD